MFKRSALTSLLALLLAVLLAAPGLAAVTDKGVFPVVDAETVLRVATPVNAKVVDIKTNQLTLWLQEKTGLTFEFIELSPSDTATQVNMMMTSGDLPDVFMGYNFSYDMLCSYAEAGQLIALDPYIAQYGDSYLDMIARFPIENPEAYVTYEGQIYAVPTTTELVTNIYSAYNLRIQGAFLQALGMEMPTTLDELKAFLIGVRDEDVNGNGDPDDEVPMAACTAQNFIFKVISQAYQYTDTNTYLKQADGKVEFIANNDLFKEAVEYLKGLVDEGLVDPASWTQDQATLTTLNAQADAMVGVMAVGNFFSSYYDTQTDRFRDVLMTGNLAGPHGYSSSMIAYPGIVRALTITSACQEPAAAFRLFDFLTTEEAAVAVRIGFEGEQWEPAAEGTMGRDGGPALYQLIKTQEWVEPSTNVIWNVESIIYSDRMNHVVSTPSDAAYTSSRAIVEYGIVEADSGEQLPQLLMSAEDTTEYDELRSLIVNYINENVSLFALGYRPMAEWDAFVAEFEAMGLERYVELAQEAME